MPEQQQLNRCKIGQEKAEILSVTHLLPCSLKENNWHCLLWLAYLFQAVQFPHSLALSAMPRICQ